MTNRERLKRAIDDMELTEICLEIYDRTFVQAREALNHLLYANHKPCLGCDGCSNARKALAAMEDAGR